MTINYNIKDLQTTAKEVLKVANNKVFLFYGEMGVGKTTLIKELTKCLGSSDNVSSPTFSIVNEYDTEKVGLIYHFDFYRIKDDYEAIDLGVEDYLYSGCYCFIEWPEKIENFLPEECLEIEILQKDDYLRELVIREHGKRSI